MLICIKHRLLNFSRKIMTNSSDQRIYDAATRIISGLERIEGNLQYITLGHDRDLQQNQHLVHYQRENAELLMQQQKLQGTIESLEQQYKELQGVAGTIYGKLDSSIDRLNQILEKS
jgi:hypothetical protein